MGFRKPAQAIACQLLLLCCGPILTLTWDAGLYATFAVAALLALWLTTLTLVRLLPQPSIETQVEISTTDDDRVILRGLLDQTPAPLVAVDRKGNWHAANRAARQAFGTDDLIPGWAAERRDPSTGDEIRLGGRTHRMEVSRVDGTSSISTLVALTDIEDSLRIAEARATRELLQVLSHEMMNGLTPVVSLAESAAQAIDAAKPLTAIRDMIGTLARRSAGLHRFTEAFREMSRLPAPELAAVNLGEMIEDVSRMFSARWGQTVDFRVEVRSRDLVVLDRDQISQALWALLQNAAEAALAGTRPSWVFLEASKTNKACILRITDSGAGVEDAIVEDVFRPFYTTKPQGSGIGLSLARQIAQAHGGTLEYELVTEAGARFTLMCPQPHSDGPLAL